MTKEGILARGKKNYEEKNFLDNPETLAYMETLEVEEEKPKKKEKKNGK